MTLRLVLAPGASEDLQDAADFYEMQESGLGLAFLRSVDEALSRIVSLPSSHPVDERGVRTAYLRRFPYGIHFRRVVDRIEILAVWHERRDPDGWRARGRGDR